MDSKKHVRYIELPNFLRESTLLPHPLFFTGIKKAHPLFGDVL